MVSEDLRRLLINATYHPTGLDVPLNADVSYVDPFILPFTGFLKIKKLLDGERYATCRLQFRKSPTAIDPMVRRIGHIVRYFKVSNYLF